MDSNFRAFWLAPVTWNILGYSLFWERREKWRVVSRKFQKKKLWPLIKTAFFYPSDLVNTKTTIPLRVGEERWIYTSTLRVSVYFYHYSPPSPSGDSYILYVINVVVVVEPRQFGTKSTTVSEIKFTRRGSILTQTQRNLYMIIKNALDITTKALCVMMRNKHRIWCKNNFI